MELAIAIIAACQILTTLIIIAAACSLFVGAAKVSIVSEQEAEDIEIYFSQEKKG